MKAVFGRKRAQSIVELALFGSLVLMVFGTLLAYLQRFNDQQYAQMETFRRALQRASTYQGNDTEGAGGSVQYTLIQHRRHSDLQGGFMKGSPQTFSASSNVFWAVPKVSAQSENLIALRVNEDEFEINTEKYKSYINATFSELTANATAGSSLLTEEDLSFQTEPPNFSYATAFDERTEKQELPEEIVNQRSSVLRETINTTIDYTISRNAEASGAEGNTTVVKRELLWAPEQRLYLDSDGQYKYSSQIPEGAEYIGVERQKSWTTPF